MTTAPAVGFEEIYVNCGVQNHDAFFLHVEDEELIFELQGALLRQR